MTGDLYEALAWDNGGAAWRKRQHASPGMYDDAAIRELIVAIQNYREAIRRALEACGTPTNSQEPRRQVVAVHGGIANGDRE